MCVCASLCVCCCAKYWELLWVIRQTPLRDVFSHTQNHRACTTVWRRTHTLLMPGNENHILLDFASTSVLGDLCQCVCVFSPFTHKTHIFWSLCHDATASQFAPKPARWCLHEYVFEKFKVQLCRLNMSYTVFVCVVLAPPHNRSQVSPCAEKLQLWRQRKNISALQATSRQIWPPLAKL